ncbi:MAG TPA: sugar ABC transporter substrate-binding protein [Firmicutes bacterium]|nr:sugar ABC transporter substrate-binding protein [Bacillota bacterium]
MQRRIIKLSVLITAFFVLWGSLSVQAAQKLVFGFKGISGELTIVEELVAEFEELYPDVDVEIVSLVATGDWWEKLALMFATGTAPDVTVMEYQRSIPFVAQGALLPLDDLIANDPSFNLEDFFPSAIEAHTYQGKIYGIPKEIQPFTLFVNTDMLDNAGLPFPGEDWDIYELRNTARRLTDPDRNQWGWRIEPTPTRLSPFLLSFGGQLFSDDLSTSLVNSPEIVQGLEFIIESMDYGALPPWSTMSQANFTHGNTAFYLGGPWMVPDFRKLSFNWDIVAVPKGPGAHVTTLGCDAYQITSQSKNPELAWEFVKFMTSAEAQARMAAQGSIVPARRELVFSPEFQNPTDRPFNIEGYNIGLQIARPSQTSPIWEDFSDLFIQYVQVALSREISAQEAMDQLAAITNELLAWQAMLF